MVSLILAAAALALGLGNRALAANGAIDGKAINSVTGRGVAGAVIRVAGTSRTATTDLEGDYRLTEVPAGAVDLMVTKESFQPLTVSGVSISDGRTAKVEFPLAPAEAGVVKLAAMSVSADVVAGSDIGLLNARQKAAAISDAIGSDRFARLAVSNAADAMTKVTGASLVDGKYVLIRGLGDRYSNTLLNGVAVPTADPDKRAVQMDQFPADLIESITTSKSFTPDQPGSFSGGSVNVKTKSFPEQFFFTIGTSFALSYNSNTTRAAILTVPGRPGDNLARGASDRAAPDLPTDIPNRTLAEIKARQGDFTLAEQLDAATKAFDNRPYYPTTTKADPNVGASFAIGDRITWGEGEKIFGYTASLTYERTFEHYEDAEKNRYQGIVGAVQPKLLLTNRRELLSYGDAPSLPAFMPPFGVTSSSRLVSWAAFTKFAFRPTLNHELSLDLFHTQSADDRVQRGVGEQAYDYAGAIDEVYALLYTQRTIDSAQLAGKSLFPSLHELQVDWHAALMRSTQEQPDYRTESFYYDPAGNLVNAVGVQPNRFFRDLDEDSKEGGVDFTLPFDVGAREVRLKFGAVGSRDDRTYREQRFQWTLVPQTHAALEAFPGPVGIIGRTADSVTFGNTITRLREPNNYKGRQQIGGSYAMVDLPVTGRLRAIAGARVEQTRIEARPVRIPGLNPRDGVIDETDALPALSFIYALTPKSNVRLAYGRTIARPTFKELTDIRYEDVFTLDTYLGNPDLHLTKIDNFDLRWELFPRRGETMAVSAFYKRMRDPIEVVYRPQAGSIQPQNVERGRVYGVEFEFRRRLGFLGDAFAPFSFGSNLAVIASSVTIPQPDLASIRLQEPGARDTRALLGQSPYVFNADLTWESRRSEVAATLSFNVVGPRLSLVQFGSIPDVYEQPAPTLNLVVSQRVWRGLRLKLAAKNLLDPDHEKTIGLIDRDLVYERYRTGRTFSVSLTYLFE